MSTNDKWSLPNIVDSKYCDYLQRIYPQQQLHNLLLLNIDLRLLYLKYIFMIENILKNILLANLTDDEFKNEVNNDTINPDNLKQMKTAYHIIRTGYNKYQRNGILKSRTIRGLIEVISFEWMVKLLHTLDDNNISAIAHHFGINDINDHQMLLEQIAYIKDVRNYLAHNFKVLGIQFKPKERFAYYEQTLNANNDHHYLHLLITRFSGKNSLLPPFNSDYERLFKKYQVPVPINDTGNDQQQHNEENNNKPNPG